MTTSPRQKKFTIRQRRAAPERREEQRKDEVKCDELQRLYTPLSIPTPPQISVLWRNYWSSCICCAITKDVQHESRLTIP